jgi:sporulation-control protein
VEIFRKSLASFGIGSAKVDARLEKSTYMQGEIVRGKVYVSGGQAEQSIDEIYLHLFLQYEYEENTTTYLLERILLSEPFTVAPKEERQVPFEFQLPYDTPISTVGAPIFLQTGLDIRLAKDPQDVDGIEVLPHPYIDMVLEAIELNGLRLTEVAYDYELHFSRHPFIQMYHCDPTETLQFELDRASFVFYPQQDEIEVIMHLDKRGDDLFSSMEEAFQLDVRLGRFVLHVDELQQGKEYLAERIQAEIEKTL